MIAGNGGIAVTVQTKPIEGYEGRYSINSDGTVYSHVSQRLLRHATGKRGYVVVSLWKHNHGRTHYVHQLVARAFCDGFEPGLDVNHKDRNRENNCASNLEYATRRENIHHALQNGGGSMPPHPKGGLHPRAKLSDAEAMALRLLKGCKTQKALAKQFRVSVRTVARIHGAAVVGERA